MTTRTARAQWRALGVPVTVVLTDPWLLAEGRRLLTEQLAAIDRACSRFREDSEVAAIARAAGCQVAVSPLLAEVVAVALDAAQRTNGAVDPTLGSTLAALGYDRDFAAVPADGPPLLSVARSADWRWVRLDRAAVTVTVPAGVRLDLGATAKAFAADRAAAALHETLGCGVLVSLGGDIAVAGAPPEGGWAVRVQDRPGPIAAVPTGPSQTIAIRSGGLATSSTTSRTWRRGGALQHHIVDPRTLRPAASPWRTVSVVAGSCVRANTASTAAIVAGDAAVDQLWSAGLPARLVAHDGSVTVLGGWPPEPAQARAS